MASKRTTRNQKPLVTYAIRKRNVARLRESTISNGAATQPVQTSLSGFDGLTQPKEQSAVFTASVAAHNALRRYGIEGEEAFLVLASRYLDTQKAMRRDFSFFPMERGFAALNI